MIKRNTSKGKLKLGLNRPLMNLNQAKNMAVPRSEINLRLNPPLVLKISHLRQRSNSSNQPELNTKENRSVESKDFIVRKRLNSESKNTQTRTLEATAAYNQSSHNKKYHQIIQKNIANFLARTAGAKGLVRHVDGFLQFDQSSTQLLIDFSNQLLAKLPQIQTIDFSSQNTEITNVIVENRQVEEKGKKQFIIELAVNQHILPSPKSLGYTSHTVNEHMRFQSELRDGQRLWSLCQKVQQREATEDELLQALQKFDFLLREVGEREQQKRELSIELEESARCLELRAEELQSLSSAIAAKQSELGRFENRLQEIKEHIHKQPSEFMRIAVAEYKKSEQELFNLADFLNVTEADKIDIWTGHGIKVADRAHGVYLKDFCARRFDEHGRSSVSKEELAFFREKLETNYATVIKNYNKLLEERIVKIEEFVDLMRKVAETTAYKRDHVDDINKRLAAVTVLLEQQYERVEAQLKALMLERGGEAGSLLSDYVQLQRLNKVLSDLFTEGMVFY